MLDKLPKNLLYKGQTFKLHVEKTTSGMLLTYEHDPIAEESFLISTHAKDEKEAVTVMLKQVASF